MPKYLNPYTDFGFKKLFGEEGSKELLLDFLNQLLPAHHQIAQLRFKNVEQLPNVSEERKAIFDIYCQSVTGERFLVEMQQAKLQFFKDRALFYVTFPFREQAEKGEWNFRLLPIYFVAILDFCYDEAEERHKLRRDVALRDQDGDLFFANLQFRFLQMPRFQKSAAELVTRFDKWLYFLKHLEDLDQIPQILNEPIFTQAFHRAELANLDREQFMEYEQHRLAYLTLKSAIDTAKDEGRQEGREEGKQEGREEGKQEGREEGKQEERLTIARAMQAKGLTIDTIMQLTGLTTTQLDQLK